MSSGTANAGEALPRDPAQDPSLGRSGLNFPVLGIGASAGGVQALSRFFEHMPAQSGMAFVVVMHLSTSHDSPAAAILARVTPMPVSEIADGMAILPDHVYVMPPGRALWMRDGLLLLPDVQRVAAHHVAIDTFFRVLAQVHRQHAIGIVLSGAGTSGAVGLKRIMELGGVTLAQTPGDAEHAGMPRAAMATGIVDFVLPAAEMPAKLLRLVANAKAMQWPADSAPEAGMHASASADDQQRAEAALADIMQLLHTRTRHDFRHCTRPTVLRRIERRMQVTAMPSLRAYRDHLASHPEEMPALLQDMLISVTNFFRDGEAFDALEHALLTTLKAAPGERGLRAWVVGCASGEEAYSVAMLLEQLRARLPASPSFQVFASDLDARALAIARSALYPDAIVTDVSPARLQAFFVREGDQYRVSKRLRERVLFTRHDVLRDPPFSRMDLVLCRNLLISLDRSAQTAALDSLRFALRPGGTLFLGSSETADLAGDAFGVIDKRHRLYRLAAPDAEPHQHANEVPQQPLEAEIRRLQQQLQHEVKRAESSTEELKSLNAELQAVNEELSAVASQLALKVEEAGRANDDLRNFIDAGDVATIVVDRDMRIRFYTPRATTQFHLVPGDIGRSLQDITHRLVYPDLVQDADAAIQRHDVIEREVRSGDDGRVIARLLPYRTAGDKVDGAILSVVDVTTLRRAQAEARDVAERLRVAAESTRDVAIITMDDQGTVTGWNRGATRLFGHEEGEIVGQNVAMIYTDEDGAAGVPARELAQARGQGRSEDERWHRHKDGSVFFCNSVTTCLDDGRGFARIVRDLTGSQQVAQAREWLLSREQAGRRQAEATMEAKELFLAVMSHELKHPLNLIHLNAELLARMPEIRHVPAATRAAAIIRQTVAGQARIIDDLLDLSRARTGKLRLDRTVVNWGTVVQRIVDALRADAEAQGVHLRVEPGAVPPQSMFDPVRAEQVVWNLLSNALKFTPEGGSVHVALAHDGDDARLTVTDTGRGIAPDFLDSVFDMFSQEGGAARRQDDGLGIGLALVRELVQAHGGRVRARSEGLGRGAEFVVWVPLHHGAAPATPTPAPPSVLKGLRVLVVDDSADSAESFAMLLELAGAEVATADSGTQALARLEKDRFDLLISDIGMPGMSGHELVQALRRREAGQSILALACSGYSRTQDERRAIASGFDALLPKPAGLEQVERAVAALQARRAR